MADLEPHSTRQLSLFDAPLTRSFPRKQRVAPPPMEPAQGLQVAVLGSGSAGNSVVVRSGDSCLLIDAGFSCRELERRLRRVGCDPGDIDAVVLTHEHGDHCRGVERFSRRFRVPIYGTRGTFLGPGLRRAAHRARPLKALVPVQIADYEVTPLAVDHDAREPIGVTIEDPHGHRLVLLTDLGTPCTDQIEWLLDADVLILESNHDLDMLRSGPYPWSLKRRVAGPRGHLSNHEAARFLRHLLSDRLRHVVLYHLSETNNLPALAESAFAATLAAEGSDARLTVCEQTSTTDWLEAAHPP